MRKFGLVSVSCLGWKNVHLLITRTTNSESVLALASQKGVSIWWTGNYFIFYWIHALQLVFQYHSENGLSSFTVSIFLMLIFLLLFFILCYDLHFQVFNLQSWEKNFSRYVAEAWLLRRISTAGWSIHVSNLACKEWTVKTGARKFPETALWGESIHKTICKLFLIWNTYVLCGFAKGYGRLIFFSFESPHHFLCALIGATDPPKSVSSRSLFPFCITFPFISFSFRMTMTLWPVTVEDFTWEQRPKGHQLQEPDFLSSFRLTGFSGESYSFQAAQHQPKQLLPRVRCRIKDWSKIKETYPFSFGEDRRRFKCSSLGLK